MLTPIRPLRIAVLSSRRCPGAAELLSDPARARRWNLVCAMTTDDDFDSRDLGLFRAAGVPVIGHSVRAFHRARGASLSDLSVRENSDEEAAAQLSPYRPDVLLFSSYLYVATAPLLELTGRRAINIHGSDLARTGPDGRPKYPGLRAVADAILCGEPETRATAHWVTEEVDVGPIILRSRPYAVPPLVPALLSRGDRKAVKAYAHAHQEWMLQDAWGPLWQSVIRLAVAGLTFPDRAPSGRFPGRISAGETRGASAEARA